MTTRNQNVAAVQVPEDIDAMLNKAKADEERRKEYQQRPEVIEKRRAYQEKQKDQRKLARLALKGDKAGLIEMGIPEEAAETLVSRAKAVNTTE